MKLKTPTKTRPHRDFADDIDIIIHGYGPRIWSARARGAAVAPLGPDAKRVDLHRPRPPGIVRDRIDRQAIRWRRVPRETARRMGHGAPPGRVPGAGNVLPGRSVLADDRRDPRSHQEAARHVACATRGWS